MFKKILIVRIGNIGDVLFVTPTIRKLRKVFKDARIDILTSPQGRVVVERNPYLNNIFIYRKFHKIERWFKKRRLRGELLRNNYDLCIVFESNLEYTKFAHEVAPQALRIGVASEFAKKFLHKTEEFSYSCHALENYLGIISKLLDIKLADDDYNMDFFFEEKTNNTLYGKNIFIIHSSCSSYLPSKAWEIGKFAKVARYLTHRGFSVFITGAAADKEPKLLLEELKNEKDVHNFTGKNLFEAAGLIKQSCGVVCLDTGILHISRALNKPVICLFGPSDPLHTGPIGPGLYKTIRKDFNCGPCQYFVAYNEEQKKKCLDGNITPCMKAIEAEEVIEILEGVINER
jgi:heptosyltransferase-2